VLAYGRQLTTYCLQAAIEEAGMPAIAEATIAEPPVSRDQARNALRGFFRIMELWRADNSHARAILGHPAERTFYKWRAGEAGTVPSDVVRRIGYVSGIWKALQILYSDHAQADSWVQRPNRHFGGQAPLDRMSAGDVTDLAAVRQYLDAARGPWS
jgi:hypothetical protein